jgi:RNA polymerase sigma-70 factor (ECF subfamily)
MNLARDGRLHRCDPARDPRRPRRGERPRGPPPAPAIDPYPDERLAEAAAPTFDPAARYALREGMELAFLTAIQRLPGRQRAVLILRDVLGWSGAEVAELLDTTVAAANSALQRGRATIEGALPAHRVAPGRATERELLRRYVDAWERADMDALVALLREDAVLSMPPQPAVTGAPAIAAFFGGVACGPGRSAAASAWANGRPTVLVRERRADGTTSPHRVLVLDLDAAGRVQTIHAHGDPALLAAFGG